MRSAFSGLSTGFWTGALARRFSPTRCTHEIARGLFPMIEPSTRRPRLANVEKARAISSGLTASVPRPIEK